MAIQRVFALVFPTKYERSRWFNFLKRRSQEAQHAREEKSGQKDSKAPSLGDFRLTGLASLVREVSVPRESRVIPLEIHDEALERVRRTYNLGAINQRFIEHKKKIYETSTRKIMSLTDLKNLPDPESSKTFASVKYSEDIDEEKILCFLDESNEEQNKAAGMKKKN